MNNTNWNDIFEYRDGHLYWKIRPSRAVKAGVRAGKLNFEGYIRITYKRREYSCHRIIWEIFNGPIPDKMEIDHINGIRNDNSILNLRLATKSQNTQNQKGANRSNKSSGIRGVTFHKNAKKWIAQIRLKGKRIYLGSFKTKEEAGEIARLKRLELFGEFAGD